MSVQPQRELLIGAASPRSFVGQGPRPRRIRGASGIGRALLLVPACLFLAAGCGDGGTGPPVLEEADLFLTLENFWSLEASEGSYEGWVVDPDGVVRSAGRFTVSGSPSEQIRLTSPVRNPVEVFVTLEPPEGDGAGPSEQRIIGGQVGGGQADLDYVSYLTPGVPLEEEPGTHALFTPSDNAELGYPSNEDAGIWLFNIQVDSGSPDSLNPDFYLKFTPLRSGWIYETWLVRNLGTEDEVWLSNGKFRVQEAPGALHQRARFRDDTGLGPFSGRIDFTSALPHEIVMPGADWVANPFGLPVPGDLELPLDLNGCLLEEEDCLELGQEPGPSRYHLVITIEPARDTLGESPSMYEDPAEGAAAALSSRPFFIRPYRNPIGEGPPSEPRQVEFHPEALPRGRASLEF